MFISDIRNCQNKDQERIRVDKELANIRTKFRSEKVRKILSLRLHVLAVRLVFGIEFGHKRSLTFVFNWVSNPKDVFVYPTFTATDTL